MSQFGDSEWTYEAMWPKYLDQENYTGTAVQTMGKQGEIDIHIAVHAIATTNTRYTGVLESSFINTKYTR